MSSRRRLVAMVGNPNAGKTTLFNALTGSRQKVANYPGVTVERVSSQMRLGDDIVECVDIPGIYSLTAASEDERVATSAILAKDNPPDLCVIVLDGTNLERHLFLFTQIAEAGLPVVIAVTMTDRLEAHGKELSIAALRGAWRRLRRRDRAQRERNRRAEDGDSPESPGTKATGVRLRFAGGP